MIHTYIGWLSRVPVLVLSVEVCVGVYSLTVPRESMCKKAHILVCKECECVGLIHGVEPCLFIHGFINGVCVDMVRGCVCWRKCMLCAVLGDCTGVYLCSSTDMLIGMCGCLSECVAHMMVSC